jgi:hypothetical protein
MILLHIQEIHHLDGILVANGGGYVWVRAEKAMQYELMLPSAEEYKCNRRRLQCYSDTDDIYAVES